MAVDVGVEAWVGRDVVHADRLAALQHPPRDAAVRGEAHAAEGFGHLRVLLRDVGEVELAPVRVEQQDGRTLRVQHLAALRDHQGDELVELEAGRESAAHLTEQSHTGHVVEHERRLHPAGLRLQRPRNGRYLVTFPWGTIPAFSSAPPRSSCGAPGHSL